MDSTNHENGMQFTNAPLLGPVEDVDDKDSPTFSFKLS